MIVLDKGKLEDHFGYVIQKHWGPDDDYLAVSVEIQVFESDGWKPGDEVKITIEKRS